MRGPATSSPLLISLQAAGQLHAILLLHRQPLMCMNLPSVGGTLQYVSLLAGLQADYTSLVSQATLDSSGKPVSGSGIAHRPCSPLEPLSNGPATGVLAAYVLQCSRRIACGQPHLKRCAPTLDLMLILVLSMKATVIHAGSVSSPSPSGSSGGSSTAGSSSKGGGSSFPTWAVVVIVLLALALLSIGAGESYTAQLMRSSSAHCCLLPLPR